MKRFVATVIVLALFFFDAIWAHDMYLFPKPAVLQQSGTSSLAMKLLTEEVVWFESMTRGLRLIGPQSDVVLTIPDKGDPVVEFNEPGTYVIGWQSEPLFIKVDPPVFNKYIRFEGYPGVAEARKKANQEKQPGLELYSRFVKSYIQVGPEPTEHFKTPFQYKIEIIPQMNPYSLRVGSDLDVQLLFDGKPLANHRIMGSYDTYSDIPEDYEQTVLTDENGIARFRITHVGFWIIRGNAMQAVSENPEVEWQSFWANITFEVK
jgi:uncharacterized GH25 family protein